MAFVDELLDVFKLAAGVDGKRPIFEETARGTYIYSDKQEEYSPLLPELVRGVSTVESFAQAVTEESRRRENATGDFMTVVFTDKGGTFYPDDKRRLDKWTYDRTLSQQWSYLLKNLNQEMKHLQFVRFLQGLRPSITDYTTIMREFKKVTFDGRQSVTSQPIIESGAAGLAVNFTLETKNGVTQQAMPGEVPIVLPFTRGGVKDYSLTIELDVSLDEQQQVKFRPVCPDLESITEQAIQDEVDFFKAQVKAQSDLLVLLDF